MPLVEVVVVQLGVGIGGVGEVERLLDVVVADRRVPRLAALARAADRAGAKLAVVVDRFVDDVPAVDAAFVAADDGVDVLLIRASAVSRSSGLPSTPANAQSGVWLCHTSVWPTMNMSFFSPNSTYWSAGSKLYRSGSGCTSAHFSRFSGVIVLNCRATETRASPALRPSPAACRWRRRCGNRRRRRPSGDRFGGPSRSSAATRSPDVTAYDGSKDRFIGVIPALKQSGARSAAFGQIVRQFAASFAC